MKQSTVLLCATSWWGLSTCNFKLQQVLQVACECFFAQHYRAICNLQLAKTFVYSNWRVAAPIVRIKFVNFVFFFFNNFMCNILACPAVHSNYDCSGNDIGSPTNYWFIGMTQSDCENACLGCIGCVGMQYNPPYHGCWLKNALQNCSPGSGNIIAWIPLSK